MPRTGCTASHCQTHHTGCNSCLLVSLSLQARCSMRVTAILSPQPNDTFEILIGWINDAVQLRQVIQKIETVVTTPWLPLQPVWKNASVPSPRISLLVDKYSLAQELEVLLAGRNHSRSSRLDAPDKLSLKQALSLALQPPPVSLQYLPHQQLSLCWGAHPPAACFKEIEHQREP